MSAVFAEFLEDFGSPVSMTSLPAISSAASEQAEQAGISEVELEMAKAAAHEEGYNAAKAELQAQFDAQLSAASTEHMAQMDALKTEIGQSMLQQLTHGLTEQVSEYSNKITSDVTQILNQLIDQTLVERSVSELAQTVKNALADNDTLKMKLSGPSHMLELIAKELEQQFSQLEVVETDAAELSVSFDDEFLSTKLNQWRCEIGVSQE